MKLLNIKAERYQFHYPDGKESGIHGIGKDGVDIIINVDNFIMAVNNTLYFKMNRDVYISILTDPETANFVTEMSYIKEYKK